MEFDAEFKFAKIQNSHGGGHKKIMLSSKFAKIPKFPFCGGGGGGEGGFMKFDAEFKLAKSNNSHFVRGEAGGGGCGI